MKNAGKTVGAGAPYGVRPGESSNTPEPNTLIMEAPILSTVLGFQHHLFHCRGEAEARCRGEPSLSELKLRSLKGQNPPESPGCSSTAAAAPNPRLPTPQPKP